MRVNANKNVKRELIATSGAATGWLAGSKLPYQNFCTPLKNIFNQMIHSLFMLWSLSHCMSSEHTHCTNGTIANVGNIYLRTHKFRTYSTFRLASHEYCLWYMIWFHGGCTKDAVRITYTTTTITHILQPFFETNVFSLAFSLVIGRENSWFSTIFFVWLIKIMVILGDFSKNGKSPLNWRSARCKTINFRPNKKLSIFSFAARCNCWFWFWSVVWNENVFVSFLVLFSFSGELLPFFSRVVSL